MSEVVNLRLARKAKARAKAAGDAAANRAAYGRTGAEKREAAAQIARHDALIDGARREPAAHVQPADTARVTDE